MDATATLLDVDPVTLLSFEESLVFNNCTLAQGVNNNTYYNYALAEIEKNTLLKRIAELEIENADLIKKVRSEAK